MYTNGSEYTGALVVGQKVYCGLEGGKYGVISAIHPRKDAGGVIRIAPAWMEYDIVWIKGTKSARVPDCILRGVQWKISAEIVGLYVIEEMKNSVEEKIRKEKEDAQRQKDERPQIIERLKADHPQLQDIKGSKQSHYAAGAANLRKELKAAFPSIKFSVRSEGFSMGCAIDVYWTDGPEVSEIKTIAKKYQYGEFDGMRDMAYIIDNLWSDIFGGAKYVMCHREETAVEVECELIG